MREYQPAINGRPAVVTPGRRWPDKIKRIKPVRSARPSRRAEAVERRARQAQVQQRAWTYVPDPRWHRRGR